LRQQTELRLADLAAGAGEAPERAWRELYAREFDGLYRFVCRAGVPPGDVEDVVQDVFVRAHRRLGQGELVENLPGWMRGIALRAVCERRRWFRVRRLKQWLLRDTTEAETPRPASPEIGALRSETQAQVARVLERMSPKLRAVLVLLDLDERELGEAAEILAVPENTVRSRRRLAREQFQKLWRRSVGAR
jgi:RNA polymerase sigma-70 factor (ECF subfamily)